MSINVYQVDAFTRQPFAGNPAAVCVLDAPADEVWMQQVAREMNLSETAFLHPQGNDYRLRWFTPLAEVDLCGHATLAGAHILWERGHLNPTDEACFHTASGLLLARRQDDLIELDFPATPPQPVKAPPGLLAALGNPAPVYVGRSRFDYLVVLETEAQVRRLQPDFARLRELDVRGVMVSSRGDDYDFVSRFFAPAVGVDEDPVTGSAHCCLAPYWGEQLTRATMTAFQASARGGQMTVETAGDRVYLRGAAITVLQGQLLF